METALKTSDVLARLNISEDTLYALIAAKRIRAVRLGRQYRFDAEAVEEFMRGEEPPKKRKVNWMAGVQRVIRR